MITRSQEHSNFNWQTSWLEPLKMKMLSATQNGEDFLLHGLSNYNLLNNYTYLLFASDTVKLLTPFQDKRFRYYPQCYEIKWRVTPVPVYMCVLHARLCGKYLQRAASWLANVIILGSFWLVHKKLRTTDSLMSHYDTSIQTFDKSYFVYQN